MKLSNEQKNIIEDLNNNILVVAGAGCGKTYTIVNKIIYLKENNYNDDEILCISFTNDSVSSLKERLAKLDINVDVKTFHKLALEILKSYHITYNISPDNLLMYIIKEFFLSNCNNNVNFQKITSRYLHSPFNLFKKNNLYNFNILSREIFTFISFFKATNLKVNDLIELIKNSRGNIKNFLLIVLYIYVSYELENRANLAIDFNDMISMSSRIIKRPYKKYRYIIIDEFQDTSLVRFNLINKLIKYNKALLMVVGDDFQSIYKFSGCDVSLFLNLDKYVSNLKIYYLTETYRFSNELAYISSNFILKNKRQMNKKVTSLINNKSPIKIVYYKKNNDLFKLVSKLKGNILILGRNNNDINQFCKINNNGFIKDNVRFLTVHKSKGLEADNVIIILGNNFLGFPTKIKSIESVIYKTNENIKYAEERRIFYVALTRTKNNIYLFLKKKDESIFIKEIKKQYKKYIEFIDI